jgi:hypothetical protein
VAERWASAPDGLRCVPYPTGSGSPSRSSLTRWSAQPPEIASTESGAGPTSGGAPPKAVRPRAEKRDERDERDADGAERSDGADHIPFSHPAGSQARTGNGMGKRDAGAEKPSVRAAGDGAPPENPLHPAPAGGSDAEARTQAGAGAERAVRSPDALADEAEVMLLGEPLP